MSERFRRERKRGDSRKKNGWMRKKGSNSREKEKKGMRTKEKEQGKGGAGGTEMEHSPKDKRGNPIKKNPPAGGGGKRNWELKGKNWSSR